MAGSSIRSLASIIAVLLVLATTFVSARLGETLDGSLSVEQQQQEQQNDGRIKNQFIVQVAASANLNQLLRMLRNDWMDNNAQVLFEYQNAFNGFAVKGLAESVLQAFSEANPGDILLIEPDYKVQLYQEDENENFEFDDNDDDFNDDDYYDTEDQQERRRRRKRKKQQAKAAGQRLSATWGIDRVDQKNLPLDGTFQSAYDGTGVDVYVIDTGVRASHQEFNGRVTLLQDFTNDNDGIDYNGHGTHVAGMKV
jgi:hypothetical protein